MRKKIATTAVVLLTTGAANAAQVDLTGWIENGFQGSATAGNWQVQSGNDSVQQFTNGQPTVYQDGELDSDNADFWLIDWKQSDQGAALEGLSLSHVTGDVENTSANDFWAHVGTVNEVARGDNLGSTGWLDNTSYTFDLTFTDSLIEVFVDGVLEISHSGTFTDGAFGFYNYSQNQVLYAGITEDVLPPVPLPAGLPLLLAGLGAFGWMRRRQA